MKAPIFLFVFLLVGTASMAQNYDKVTIARFKRPDDKPLVDTLKNLLNTPRYQDFIADEVDVYPAKSKNNFSALKSLLSQIRKNGSDDISRCFIPRHVVNYYKNGKVVDYALICFECEGIRFSDERRLTAVKNEKKRETQMKKLEELFRNYNLVQ